jgi:prolyl-tRNA synthetase
MVVMRRTDMFLKTRKEAPADETAKNAQLLIRAGYIHKEMAGVYSFLPLGLITLNKIIDIIRQEIDAIGGQEMFMSTLQNKELWEKSGRWHDEVVDVWFKTRLHGGQGFHQGPELGLSNTHEEALTAIMTNFVHSYKDLPVYAYHFQTKFRNEPRAKSGLLRCREFIMKDLYSFCRSQEEHDDFYQKAQDAYTKIFGRLGLASDTYLTFASGGSFSKYSHEFQTIADVGEDTVYVHEGRRLAVNKEVYSDEVLADLGLSNDELVEKKAVEVGNVFSLGTRFSDAMGLTFTDELGASQPVIMGSYGIGPGRVMGLIVEKLADEHGLVWSEDIAPAKVYLIKLGTGSKTSEAAENLYKQLTQAGVGVIYDNRDERAGEMFADADLLGIPLRMVVSEKTLAQGSVELKERSSEDSRLIPTGKAIESLVR